MRAIENLKEDGNVTISLLITMGCNFRCNHCMYGSKLKKGQVYMSNEILSLVRLQVLRLQKLDCYPTINLIGGEPTLNMIEFERVLSYVMQWGINVEMTTNGHWLKSVDLTREFLRVVASHIDYSGQGLDGQFQVRISNDQYHESFRPAYHKLNNLQGILSDIWEGGEVLYSEYPVCNDCYVDLEEDQINRDDDTCKECGNYIDYEHQEEFNYTIPAPDPDDPWIYVESHKYDGVISIGNAQGWGNINHSSDNGCHLNDNKLTYTPDGILTDICCKGSWLNAGSVKDDPIVLLEMANRFKETKKPDCRNCRDLSEEYVNDSWDREIEIVYLELGEYENEQTA